MLVVSRKPGERILIGEGVQVTVLAVRGDQVSLGISAPRDVAIHREELLARIRRENQRAAAFGPDALEALRQRLRPRLSPPPTPAGEGEQSPLSPSPRQR